MAGAGLPEGGAIRNGRAPRQASQCFEEQRKVDGLFEKCFSGRRQRMRKSFGPGARDDEAQTRLALGQAFNGVPVIASVVAQAKHGDVEGVLLGLAHCIPTVARGNHTVVGLHQSALQRIARRGVGSQTGGLALGVPHFSTYW